MRVLICGSRDYTDKYTIKHWLEANSPEIVIEGEASGADTLARLCAEELNIPCLKFPADWKKYGKAAGPIRNKQMLKEGKPELVVAFHNNIERSKGTLNMINQAKKVGIPTVVIAINEQKVL